MRKSVFDEVGGFDEALAVAFNDVDFCLRVRARGYRILWTPYAELLHHESATRGYEVSPEKRERYDREHAFMRARWGDALLADPAYNPKSDVGPDGFHDRLAAANVGTGLIAFFAAFVDASPFGMRDSGTLAKTIAKKAA